MTNKETEKSKSVVPILLTLLIGVFILFLAWSGKQASTGGTDITDRDYYSKGLKYNSTLVEKRAASVIGWKLTSRLDGKQLSFSLRDKDDRPIEKANGQLFLSASGSEGESLKLREENPGHYRTELPEHYSGEQLVRVDFERDGARINRQLLLNIPDSGGS